MRKCGKLATTYPVLVGRNVGGWRMFFVDLSLYQFWKLGLGKIERT